MRLFRSLTAAIALLSVTPLAAQEAPSPETPPRLIVVISVDQFSANLFAEYRPQFRFGFARMASGAVFPSGYQSHSATETCPGHSTILTGARPARTGIIANDWIDLNAQREDKTVYCAEDETIPGSNSDDYTVSPVHLRVPTLGEWMKAADPRSRVIAVAGKDRAAVMMAGHDPDQIWWWGGDAFVSYAGREAPATITRINASVASRIATAQPALPLPDFCRPRAVPVPVGNGTIGDGRFARQAGDSRAFRASPEFDEAVTAAAAGLATELELGQGDAPDLLIIGASATDYVGHAYGTQGSEMCLQLLSLDEQLGKLFAVLDTTGVDYAVVLTADHGGTDATERQQIQGVPGAHRITADPVAGVAASLGLPGDSIRGDSGNYWIDPSLSAADHDRLAAAAIAHFEANPDIAGVFTRDQILATPMPTSPPEDWSMIERARASYDTERSGEIVIALKPRVSPIARPGPGYASTHGSFWDYDRRVPILFWRKGMTGFEQPLSVETVDIAPSLAGLLHLPVPVEIDGRCLDLDASGASTCPAR
ncbi:alkaline phosphatase family protein [Stakelama tenebrarum]|uniref:Alkaline phosphatase n=1 Tax=Stakelama tenebrarum TaxID=2711215 RepID=A0A6G6Y8P9_9SPHN|nr:alkaline phosphatase family protein [Sphingosinithalassobacter tenebrarum]QIG81305.1 alkaline phosphatase family protein [Sphingosinithalassobacter tenebrarum]